MNLFNFFDYIFLCLDCMLEEIKKFCIDVVEYGFVVVCVFLYFVG